MKEDYYKILGISRDASAEEIKQQYRKMALKYHPDRNPDNKKESEETFKKVNQAYEVLSDPQKKQQYDNFGTEDGGGFDFGFGGGGQGGFNFDEIFKDVFSGFSRSSGRGGADIEENITLSFEESYMGVSKNIMAKKKISCGTCSGTGSKNSKTQTCGGCQGAGVVRTSIMGMYMSQTCNRCNGSGSIIRDPCDKCGGSGLEKKNTEIKLDIPAGVENNMKLRFPGLGNSGGKNQSNGDLLLQCSVSSHKIFTRKESDLCMKLDVSIKDIILGAKIPVTLPDNKSITVEIPAGHTVQEDIRMPKMGFHQINSRHVGAFVVSLNLKLPKKLNEEQKKLFNNFVTSLEQKSSWW